MRDEYKDTMRVLLTLIIVLCFSVLTMSLTGCTSEGPKEGLGVNTDIIKIYNQDKAMLMFESMVEDHFNVELHNVFEDAVIWWADGTCQGRDGYCIQYKRGQYAGIMFGCGEIYVALSNLDETKTCGSALLHEFAHCLSFMVHGHYGQEVFGSCKGKHTGEIWEVLEEAEFIACARGW